MNESKSSVQQGQILEDVSNAGAALRSAQEDLKAAYKLFTEASDEAQRKVAFGFCKEARDRCVAANREVDRAEL